jgi:sporulation protein YlmC with PRC-barrel domain
VALPTNLQQQETSTMRSYLIPPVALAAAAALAAPAWAQQQPPAQEQAGNANQGQTAPMQALQDARQKLQAAAEELRQARQGGDQQAASEAKPKLQQAIDQVRQAMLQLSPEQRANVQTTLRQAEQGLQVNNSAHSLAAMGRLVDIIAVVAVPMTTTSGTGTSAAAAGTASDIEVVSSTDWNYDELYADGWRGEELIDTAVYGPTGEEIGEVENVIIGPDNKILSVIAEVGGVWDIGDTHVNVPWNEVKTEAGREGVTIPVTQETVEDYSLFPDEVISAQEARTETEAVDDDLTLGPRAWKLTALINDYVGLADTPGYGYVDDVIFNKEGELKAVVVQPDVTWGAPGYYAYPYYGWGYGWDPTLDYYEVPYSRDEVAGLDTFDYGEVDEEFATSSN